MTEGTKITQRHEQWAVAVAAAAVFAPLLSLAVSTSMLDGQPWANSWWWRMLGTVLVTLLTRVAVGAWLYQTAGRDGNSPAVWFALGAVFSLPAALLYFLLQALGRETTLVRAQE